MPKNIFKAAYDNDIETLRALLKADPNLKDARFAESRLQFYSQASAWGLLLSKKALAGFFILGGMGALVVETGGMALLEAASLSGVAAGAWKVGDRSLYYYICNREGWTPLAFAAYNNSREAAELLIKAGASDTSKVGLGKATFKTFCDKLINERKQKENTKLQQELTSLQQAADEKSAQQRIEQEQTLQITIQRDKDQKEKIQQETQQIQQNLERFKPVGNCREGQFFLLPSAREEKHQDSHKQLTPVDITKEDYELFLWGNSSTVTNSQLNEKETSYGNPPSHHP